LVLKLWKFERQLRFAGLGSVRDGPWRWQIGLKRVSGDRSAIG
jgi:hypothetical protein